MSVRIEKRNISPIEWVDKARQIADVTIDRMTFFIKKLCNQYKECKRITYSVYSYLYESPLKGVTSAYLAIRYANSIKNVDNQSFSKRQELLNKAIQSYQDALLSISLLNKKF